MKDQFGCPICKSNVEVYIEGVVDPKKYFFGKSEYQIATEDRVCLPVYKCKACGHGFVPISFEDSVIDEWYRQAPRDTVFMREETGRRKTAQIVLDRINRLYEGKKGVLLDVGCGPGLFLSEAQKNGWSIEGVEVAKWAVEYAKEKMNIVNVNEGGVGALSVMARDSFDVITCFDLIEHLVDPVNFLQELACVIKPGGLLLVTTPCFDSWLSHAMGGKWFSIMPEHLHYFSENSLRQLFDGVGFKVKEKKLHTRHFTIKYGWDRLLNSLGAKKRPLPIELIVPVNLGDELEVYAFKS
jgi:2-polyprenyl-3-methyl-5-hydroxy-6-metoxy-1,4-benzoquinol methylase